ncbi:MAG: isocitrate dehydrogenase (NADP(+)) [candidate division Zixibacteria bacterium]|nr:isocitrate dehydrogenase (NADP(+)) [candidate division Zixibacteria bacterium]
MRKFKTFTVPREGEKISFKNKKLLVPDYPVIPYIEGDGIGTDIMPAAQKVLNAAVEKSYGPGRKLVWVEIFAGEKAFKKYGEWIPKETYEAIRFFMVSLKGPLTTPIGGGYRSLNVTLRQILDLYACVRPVRYFEGVPAPVKSPQDVNLVIFRENTEDVYAGLEWKKGTPEAKKLISFLNKTLKARVRPDSGVGIKPISAFATKRLVRKALQYALDNNRKTVTLIHKGNIMKFTEGAFRDWGYEVAKKEFGKLTVLEEELRGAEVPPGKIVVNDRIADSIFQQILIRPKEYDVLACPNLVGDFLSDAAAAQVGGLGMAPGGNIGEGTALFEATHGTAPKYAGQNKVNPGSLILSGAMLLEYLGWKEAAGLIYAGLEKALRQKTVTYDLERQMSGAQLVSTSGFADRIVAHLNESRLPQPEAVS